MTTSATSSTLTNRFLSINCGLVSPLTLVLSVTMVTIVLTLVLSVTMVTRVLTLVL